MVTDMITSFREWLETKELAGELWNEYQKLNEEMANVPTELRMKWMVQEYSGRYRLKVVE